MHIAQHSALHRLCVSIKKMEFLKEEAIGSREFCEKAQQQWKDLSKAKEEVLSAFCKKKVFTFIWESNLLEDTIPKETKQSEVEAALLKIIDNGAESYSTLYTDFPMVDKPTATQQLTNHLLAYLFLCCKHSTMQQFPELTEERVKYTHGAMMQGLETDDGTKVNAGVYRTISVHAGDRVFPSYKCVPANMARIVAEYESKASSAHDPYQLASWLFFQVVSLHPFEDGNGRLSRLLWCYSLMRDGLPFPVVLTSGHQRSQAHLVSCLERDRRLSASDQPHLTTLSMVSVRKAWDSFLEETKSLMYKK